MYLLSDGVALHRTQNKVSSDGATEKVHMYLISFSSDGVTQKVHMYFSSDACTCIFG